MRRYLKTWFSGSEAILGDFESPFKGALLSKRLAPGAQQIDQRI
jgi:hypothetical protein